MEVAYALEPSLPLEEFVDILERSGLAARRPMDAPDTLRAMVENADVLVTARVDGRLAGISRAITDGCYCTYLSDLAVDVAYQRKGIGKELIARTHAAAGSGTILILLSAPAAASYYPHIGMTQHGSCWYLRPDTARPGGMSPPGRT